MRAPKIKARRGIPGDYAERTAECTFPKGDGFLLTLKVDGRGNRVDIDRADGPLRVCIGLVTLHVNAAGEVERITNLGGAAGEVEYLLHVPSKEGE